MNVINTKQPRDKVFVKIFYIIWALLAFYVLLCAQLNLWSLFFTYSTGLFLFSPITFVAIIFKKIEIAKLFFIGCCNFYIFMSYICVKGSVNPEYYIIAAAILPLVILNPRTVKTIFVFTLMPYATWLFYSYFSPQIPSNELKILSLNLSELRAINFTGSYFLTVTLIMVLMNTLKVFNQKTLDQSDKENKDLEIAQKIGKIGSWEYNIKEDKITWSNQMFSIFPWDSAKGTPTMKQHEGFISKNDLETWKKMVANGIKTKSSFNLKFKTFRFDERMNKVTVWVHAKGDCELAPNGKLLRMVGTCQDISESTLLIKQLEEQKKISFHNSKLAMIGELAAGVGHEINNPLAIIKSYQEILVNKITKNKYNKEETISILDKIDRASNRIANIINGLRSLSRSDENSKSQFDISSVLKETLDLVSEIYAKDGITITYEELSNTSKKYALGDKGKFQQVLMNLISNARDSLTGQKAKRINITLEENQESQFILKVKDTGSGMSKEIQDKIFDPFFTTKEVDKGTGIGLTLVFNYLQEMSSTIQIESTLGVGSVFTLLIPILDPRDISDEFPTSKSSLLPQLKSTSKKSILVVDDEPGIREVLVMMFEDEGYNTFSAANGQEALALVNDPSIKFDILLTDMKMPIMDGYSLIKEISQLESPRFKIIVMTGGVNIDFESSSSEIKHLIDSTIYKPFQLEEVLSLVTEKVRKAGA